MARSVGFAQSPAILRVLGIIPGLGIVMPLLVIVWIFVAMVIAVHGALEHPAHWKAAALVTIGFVPYVAIVAGLLLLAGQV